MKYNYNWAKFVSETRIDYAPEQITKGNTTYIPYPEDMMVEDGYKRVALTPMPTADHRYISTWRDDPDQITQVWIEDTTPEEPTEIDILSAQVLYTALMTDTLLED